MIMQGFVGFRIPVWLRRLVTMLPAFVVIGFGANPTRALIISQVVLSIALPVPMAMVVWFSSSRRWMAQHRNRHSTIPVASFDAAVVMALNLVLLWQTLT